MEDRTVEVKTCGKRQVIRRRNIESEVPSIRQLTAGYCTTRWRWRLGISVDVARECPNYGSAAPCAHRRTLVMNLSSINKLEARALVKRPRVSGSQVRVLVRPPLSPAKTCRSA